MAKMTKESFRGLQYGESMPAYVLDITTANGKGKGMKTTAYLYNDAAEAVA